jgi:DNA/RNA endonuclease YhcR with UshA esterase domain
MDDSILIKACLIISLIGVFLLFMISDNVNLDYVDIESIKNKDEGRIVRIRGVVKDIKDMDSLMIINVMQENMIPVVLFKENNKTKINTNSFVEIEGEVRIYKGKPEIIADKVKTKLI